MKTFNSQIVRISKISLMFFVLTALIISCGKVQKPEGEEEEDPNYEQENYEARKRMLKHIVPLGDAVKMYHDYSENRIRPLKGPLRKKHGKDFNDTRIVSMNLETMKQYIAYIEEKSKDLKVKPEGLRFYFGVYPNKDNNPHKKGNHQTFFIAPSTLIDSVQYGYTFETIDDEEHIIYLKDKLNSDNGISQNPTVQKASFFTAALLVDDDGLLLNRGVPNPPGN